MWNLEEGDTARILEIEPIGPRYSQLVAQLLTLPEISLLRME